MKRLTHDWTWRSDLLGRGKGCRGAGHWGRGAGMLLRLWHVILEVLSLAILPQTQIPVPLQGRRWQAVRGCCPHPVPDTHWPPLFQHPHRTADDLLLKGVPADVTHTGLVAGQLLHDVATEEVVHCPGKARVEKGSQKTFQPSLISPCLSGNFPPFQRSKAHMWECC